MTTMTTMTTTQITDAENVAIQTLSWLLLCRLREVVSNLDIYVAAVELRSETFSQMGIRDELERSFICMGLMDHVRAVKEGKCKRMDDQFPRMLRILYKEGHVTARTFDQSTWAEMEALYGRIKVVRQMLKA